MMFPIIKVRDKDTGREHIVGTDSHDSLLIENGFLCYYNLQNGEGSRYGTYTFLGLDDEFGARVEFVTFEELQKIYEEQKVIAEEQAKKMEELLKKISERAKSTNGEMRKASIKLDDMMKKLDDLE